MAHSDDMRLLSDLLFCLRFYSRLPLPVFRFEAAPHSMGEFGRAVRLAPIAGLLIALPAGLLLAGAGAARFARDQGLAEIADPAAWFTRAGKGEANHPPGTLAHGTVGCVVRDADGRLAAATSTGGVFNKLPGRVGDTPIIGAGTFADAHAAISCTGQGEYFMRNLAAAQVAMRMRLAGQSLADATAAVLAEIAGLGGDGGLIALDADGNVATPFVSEGMKRAVLDRDGQITSAAF